MILCDSGAWCGPNQQSLPWKDLLRPIFPLDQEIDIVAWKAAHPCVVKPQATERRIAAGSRQMCFNP